ncbi:hypothetical protein [Chthonomonas calidirosea]|uniref:hypothetical protein n=1 Tax=Chthonomonas calidirosea TaxID=454171 RepID=UPI0006EC7945|nr:hypothetical protein [Chthonomonas calidirosea]CEK16397.1 hypothetical protein CP488_01493 [Chthonomonas calidirosea]
MRANAPSDPVRRYLPLLWEREERAFAVAQNLYRAPNEIPFAVQQEQDWAVHTFLDTLFQRNPQKPKYPRYQRQAVITAVIHTILLIGNRPNLTYMMVTLFPAMYVADSQLAEALCRTLVMLYHKEALFLSPKPQIYWFEWTFQRALQTQHPQDLIVLWQMLGADDPITRQAAHCALQWLRTVHATAHLLFGLHYVKDHALRMILVNMLEEIAEPQVLITLARLHRETAETDWPLSRRIARAVHTIAQQNAAPNPLTLLRPADPPASFADLLQPAIAVNTAVTEASRTELLRSAGEPSNRKRGL